MESAAHDTIANVKSQLKSGNGSENVRSRRSFATIRRLSHESHESIN